MTTRAGLRRAQAAGALAVVAGFAAGVAGCAGDDTDDLPPPPSTPLPAATRSAPTGNPVHLEILDVYRGSIEAMVIAQRAGDPDHPALTRHFLARTPAHLQVLNGINLHESRGEYYEGTVEVVSAEVTDLDLEAAPPEATVSSCLDDSEYRLVSRDDDEPVPDAEPGGRYTVTSTAWIGDDDQWYIVDTEEHWNEPC